MSDDRLMAVDDALQLVEDGVFESFEELQKTMLANGVAEVCSRLSGAISELNIGILWKRCSVNNIRLPH